MFGNALSNITDDLSNSTSVTGWLEEEDPEMVTATINAITGLGKSIKGSFSGAIPGLPSPKDFIGILKKGIYF